MQTKIQDDGSSCDGTKTANSDLRFLLHVNIDGALIPFSSLIFKAVIFNILGVIEPTKEKKNPKRKLENMIIYAKFLIVKISF